MGENKKLYCYVDETGQDTKGNLFIVSVVVSAQEKDDLIKLCEKIEQETGKGQVKWSKANHTKRLGYLRRVLQQPILKGKLNFAIYRHSQDYLPLTILTIARAIFTREWRPYKVNVFIDGLPHSQTKWVGSELRHFRIQVRKVRGVRKDEADALIRLADAVCGFVRAAQLGQEAMAELLQQGKESGFLKEL